MQSLLLGRHDESYDMQKLNGRTEGEHYAYQRGLADGNAAAIRTLIGCNCPVRLVEDPSLPEGICELRVRSVADIHAPVEYIQLLKEWNGPGI